MGKTAKSPEVGATGALSDFEANMSDGGIAVAIAPNPAGVMSVFLLCKCPCGCGAVLRQDFDAEAAAGTGAALIQGARAISHPIVKH